MNSQFTAALQLNSIRGRCAFAPRGKNFLKRQGRAAKQRSNSLVLVHEAELWTDRLGCPHFFFLFLGWGQNKFQACLCRSKNQLNTKVERSTKTSFTVPLQADNCEDSEHPMHRLTKAGESDNSIYAGLLSSCGKKTLPPSFKDDS